MNSNNYLLIPGFSVSELHLTGVDRDLYSYIYSKSQDGIPTALLLSWMVEWETCSEKTVRRSLRRLEQKGLICITKRSGLPSLYKANTKAVEKALDDGHAKLPEKDPRRPKSDRTDEDYIDGKLRMKRAVNSTIIIPLNGSPSDGKTSEEDKKAAEARESLKALIAKGADWTYPAAFNGGKNK